MVFRGWEHNNDVAEIQNAPSWEFVDPSDNTKKKKAKDFVSNNVLTWDSIVYEGDPNPFVRYYLTLPPTTITSTVNFGFSYAINDLYIGQNRVSALVFAIVLEDGTNLKITNADKLGLVKIDNAYSYILYVSNENPYNTSNNYKNNLCGKIEALVDFPESLKTSYTNVQVRFNGLFYFPFQDSDAFMSIDKVYMNTTIKGTDNNNNQVETFYGGIDKQPFRKKGDDIKVSIGAPSNELHLSTLYYPLGSTSEITPSNFNQDDYVCVDDYMNDMQLDPHTIEYSILIDTQKVLGSNTFASFLGYVDTDFTGTWRR